MISKLAELLLVKNWSLATAESCTGGLVSSWITEKPGSSGWFECGFITYSNQSKQRLLNVSADTLETYGAVSEQTVREMAEGAIEQSSAQVSLAISGIAGPDGGTMDKPVGTICFAWALEGCDTVTETRQFQGSRQTVREQAANRALAHLLELFDELEK